VATVRLTNLHHTVHRPYAPITIWPVGTTEHRNCESFDYSALVCHTPITVRIWYTQCIWHTPCVLKFGYLCQKQDNFEIRAVFEIRGVFQNTWVYFKIRSVFQKLNVFQNTLCIWNTYWFVKYSLYFVIRPVLQKTERILY